MSAQDLEPRGIGTMPRIRSVKPEFFRNHKLYVAESEEDLPLRLAFAGLWTACDREGRFKWSPDELKLDCLPYDNVDFSRVLHALTTRGYIVKYRVGDELFGCVPTWNKHQVINNRESDSLLPDVSMGEVVTDACPTRAPRDTDLHKGKGRERKGKEGKGTTEVAVNDNLLRPILDSFLSEGNFANYQKETVCAKAIIKAIRNLAPENAESAAELLLVTFRQLTHGTDKFWNGQPFLPSGLSPLVERVWAEAIKNHRQQDTSWIDRVRNGI